MAVKYFPDEQLYRIIQTGNDVQQFIKEAIDEKLARDINKTNTGDK